ncbi:MAG: hypothetical protein Q9165_002437 [Trypethelium subeluteriae]
MSAQPRKQDRKKSNSDGWVETTIRDGLSEEQECVVQAVLELGCTGGIRGRHGSPCSPEERLDKVDDSGYSLDQVMEFPGHRDPKTLVGGNLVDTSNMDDAAAFLNLEPQRDITEDVRSAFLRRNPELPQSPRAKMREELE